MCADILDRAHRASKLTAGFGLYRDIDIFDQKSMRYTLYGHLVFPDRESQQGKNKRLSRSQSMSLDYLEKKFRPDQEALAALRASPVKDSLERLYAAGTPEETKQAVELGLVQAGTQRQMDMDRSQWIETELSFRILEP